MAKSSPLTAITDKAKALKKKHPHKFDHMRKRDRWAKGYIREAAKAVKHAPAKKKSIGVKRKPAKRKVSAAGKPKGKHLVRYVEKSSTERVMSGRRKKKKCHCTHRVYMAGVRRRSVGSTGGNMGLIVGLGVGALAIYLLTKGSTPTAPVSPASLPPITQTSNYTRNTQSQDIVNYALAAGLALDSISSLIDRLNSSSDSDVSNIYDSISTTGDVGAWV